MTVASQGRVLLVDLGNTRIKFASLTDAGLGEQHAAVHRDWSARDFRERVLNVVGPVDRILVSNVAGPTFATALESAAKEVFDVEVTFLNSIASAAGVRNAYSEPWKLGIDRWMALIATHHMRAAPACIVSVGTAMTIDALGGDGTHLGGVIVPGPDLMVSSLLHNTSDIAARAREGRYDEALFADNTLGGVHQGAEHALAALIDRAVNNAAEQMHASVAVVLTGGAHERVLGALAVTPQIVPDLVLRGLAVMARDDVPA